MQIRAKGGNLYPDNEEAKRERYRRKLFQRRISKDERREERRIQVKYERIHKAL